MKPNELHNLYEAIIVRASDDIRARWLDNGVRLRKRLLPVELILRAILTFGGGSLNREIRRLLPKVEERPTKSALCHARKKISPTDIYNMFITSAARLEPPPKDGQLCMIAVDGTHCLTNDRIDSPARRLLNCVKHGCDRDINVMYDTDSGIILDAEPNLDERSGLIAMLERYNGHPAVFVCDRGYISLNVIEHFKRKDGCYFLIRSPIGNGALKEIADLPDEECDIDVSIYVSNKQVRNLPKGIRCYVPKGKSGEPTPKWDFEWGTTVTFRVVKVNIGTAKEPSWEVLVTNLPREQYPPSKLKAMYHGRWKCETMFRFLKYDECMNNFHSVKDEYVLQEIYAHLLVHNFCAAAATYAAAHQKPQHINRKYEYAINFNMVIDTVRNYILGKKRYSNKRILQELVFYAVEVKPNRSRARKIQKPMPVPFVYRCSAA